MRFANAVIFASALAATSTFAAARPAAEETKNGKKYRREDRHSRHPVHRPRDRSRRVSPHAGRRHLQPVRIRRAHRNRQGEGRRAGRRLDSCEIDGRIGEAVRRPRRFRDDVDKRLFVDAGPVLPRRRPSERRLVRDDESRRHIPRRYPEDRDLPRFQPDRVRGVLDRRHRESRFQPRLGGR